MLTCFFRVNFVGSMFIGFAGIFNVASSSLFAQSAPNANGSASDFSKTPYVATVEKYRNENDVAIARTLGGSASNVSDAASAPSTVSTKSTENSDINNSNKGTKIDDANIIVPYNKVSVENDVSQRVESVAAESSEVEASGGFLQNFRPFKRARTGRVFGGRFVDLGAPEPPEVEKIGPPALTKENPNLPPLDLDGRLDENGTFATRAELDALREEAKSYTWSKGDLRIVPYGFLNLSVSSDTQRAVPGEYILFVQSPTVDDSADFTLDARTSRLGFKIDGPRVDALSADLRGCLEFDFQGAPNGSKNKGGVQLRRAFAELVDAERERRFLAGQDWEIISPLAPQMLNYLPCGFVGNMQYRRPQLRFEQGATFGPNMRWLGQIAICDDVLCDYSSTSGVAPSSASWPVVESRVAVELLKEARGGLPITLGVSGHIGEQNYKFSPIAGSFADTSEKTAVQTWSANVDVDVPIVKTQRFQGECFTGANLSSFCGGINQGVDLYRRDSIRASGGWGAIHSDWTDKLATNVGYGIDRPNEDDLVGTSVAANGFATSRTRNELYFVNVIYNWNKNLMTGLEVGYWQTGWQKADVSTSNPIFYKTKTGESVRTELAVRFSF